MKNALRSLAFITLGALAGLAQAADDAKAIVDGYMAAWTREAPTARPVHSVDEALAVFKAWGV
mgnify:CR=1 FL=1